MSIIVKLGKYYRYAYRMGHFPSLKDIFFSDKKIFAYYGYLGDNNFGDELVFESAKKVFEPNLLVPVRKFMPVSIKFFCYFFKSKFSGVIIGGGTLIGPFWDQNFFLNLISNKKAVYIHGTGVHLKIDSVHEWKTVFNVSVYGGVRGQMSEENLLPVYKGIKIAGDAAFAFFDEKKWCCNLDASKNVLINLGTHFDYDGQENARTELKKLIRYLIDNGYKINYLPFHIVDLKLGNRLRIEFPEIIILDQLDDFLSAVKIFQTCSFAIGERLHFTVMAILIKVPFISINYAKKHQDLLKSVELSHAGLSPEKISVEILKDAFENLSSFDWGDAAGKMARFKEFQIDQCSNFVVDK